MGFTNLSADRIVAYGPALLHGLVLLTSADGGDVTVYSGQDATTGQKILTVEGTANVSRPISFNPPIECDRGIYVDVGSNVTEVLIHWTPK